MARIVIDREKCKGCFLCVAVCPRGMIAQEKKLNARGATPVRAKENAACAGCCMCAVICPDCCIEVYK